MRADVIIILGHDSDKGKLSDLAKSRVDKGLDVYGKTKAKILMSGGYSLQHKKDPGYREAELMKEYAVGKGVPEKDILIEIESRDTNGNAYFTKQIAKSKKWKDIVVVSSDFHMFKVKYFFNFVYGKGYNTSYRSSKSGFKKKEINDVMKKERKSVKGMKELCKRKNIKSGEDLKLRRLLNNFYKWY
ncbi:MAG: YdcF family protein [archaeon]